MGGHYPELIAQQELISKVILKRNRHFSRPSAKD
jgi:hypothetical protein